MRYLRLLLLLLLHASAASAQYTPDQLRELQGTILATGEQVRRDYPVAWQAAHNAGEPQGSEFVRRWARTLRLKGITACVNGKRGSDTLSQDVLVFPVTSGGNRDTSGRYAQIAIIDVIGGAGGPSPTLGWGDVSAASQGKCIDPVVEPSEDGDSTPVPPVVTPTPAPPPPAPTVDLRPVLDALARLQTAVETRQVDVDAIRQTMNELILGPEVMAYLRLQLQAMHDDLERLKADMAWLRSRSVLRF